MVGGEGLRLAPPGAGVLVEVLPELATRGKSTSTSGTGSGKGAGARVAVRSVREDHEQAILELERQVSEVDCLVNYVKNLEQLLAAAPGHRFQEQDRSLTVAELGMKLETRVDRQVSSCLRFSSSTEWWTFQGTVFGWLWTRLLLCNDWCPGGSRRKRWSFRSCSGFGRRPVLGQGCCARWCNDWGRAMLDSTVDTCSASSRMAFGIFFIFYVIGWTRLMRSILVVSLHTWPMRKLPCSSSVAVTCVLLVSLVMHLALCPRKAELVVNSSRGMHSTGFAGISAPLAVFPMIAGSLPRSAQSIFLLLLSCAWKSVHYFYEAPVFSGIFHVRNFARVDFLEPSSTHRCECSRAGGWR